MSIDGGVAHRPSETCHGSGLNITGSTHRHIISCQRGIIVSQPEVFFDGLRLSLVFSIIWIPIKNLFVSQNYKRLPSMLMSWPLVFLSPGLVPWTWFTVYVALSEWWDARCTSEGFVMSSGNTTSCHGCTLCCLLFGQKEEWILKISSLNAGLYHPPKQCRL